MTLTSLAILCFLAVCWVTISESIKFARRLKNNHSISEISWRNLFDAGFWLGQLVNIVLSFMAWLLCVEWGISWALAFIALVQIILCAIFWSTMHWPRLFMWNLGIVVFGLGAWIMWSDSFVSIAIVYMAASLIIVNIAGRLICLFSKK